MLKNEKRNLADVMMLRGSFLLMYFKFGVKSLVMMVVTVMMGT